MTQDVEPLTWQKRTNIEEHQQFFSKINEIIANLAPTVDEAEQAIAQATQAIADANAAIGMANAASAAADAAAQSAQASAATVAGYATRLTAVEGEADANAADITALQGRMGTAEGNITALQNVQADYVKKAGAAQTVTSQIMVPTTATGVRDTQIANGTRIQNDLDAYESMIRTTGNQTKAGTFTIEDVRTDKVVRSKYYSVASASGYSAYPWRLLYIMDSPVSTNANTQITLIYGGARSGANAGVLPAIITIIGYGTNARAMGIGASAQTAVKVIKTDAGHIYVFGMCDNVNSGSGAIAFNMLSGRNEDRWRQITEERRCSIADGVATDTNGDTVVTGSEVNVVIS